jgi:hypothetical protein
MPWVRANAMAQLTHKQTPSHIQAPGITLCRRRHTLLRRKNGVAGTYRSASRTAAASAWVGSGAGALSSVRANAMAKLMHEQAPPNIQAPGFHGHTDQTDNTVQA